MFVVADTVVELALTMDVDVDVDVDDVVGNSSETIFELQEATGQLRESILERSKADFKLRETSVSSRGPSWLPKLLIHKVNFSIGFSNISVPKCGFPCKRQ